MIKKLLLFFAFLLFNSSYSIGYPQTKLRTQTDGIKVARILGQAYSFFGVKKPIRKLKEKRLIQTGTIVATAPRSLVYLEFDTNGIVVLAPNSQLMVRRVSPMGIRHISLIKGSVYFRTKRSYTKTRPPGVLINIRSYNTAYYGENYVLTFTKNKKEISVKSGTVKIVKLNSLNDSETKEILSNDISDEDDTYDELTEGLKMDGDDEDEDEDEDEGENEDEEDEDGEEDESEEEITNYNELLEEQREARKLLKEKKEVPVKESKKPFDLKFFMRGVWYNQDLPEVSNSSGTGPSSSPEVQFREFTAEARLDWKMTRQRGKGFINASGWFEYGNQNEIYRDVLKIFNNRDQGRGVIELNELYFLNSWSVADVSIGKKVYKMGTATIFSPADRVTPKDLYDPLNHKDLGNWMINPEFYIGNVTFSYALIPFFLPSKAPRLQNRVSTELIPDGAEPTIIYPDPELKSFQNVLQIKGTAGGWDLFLAFLYGPSNYAVYREDAFIDLVTPANSRIDYFEEYPNVLITTAGFFTTFGKLSFYGEALTQKTPSGKDDDFFTYVLGVHYTISDWSKYFFMNEIKIILEMGKEEVTKNQDAPKYIHSSTDNRSHKNSYLGRINFQYNDNLNFPYTFDLDMKNNSQLHMFGIEWKPIDKHKIGINYELFQGSNQSILSLIQDTDNLVDQFSRFTVTYKYTF